ncbi:MAG: C-terminal processing protease CtpA/Prc [Planctomycetota bacterium]
MRDIDSEGQSKVIEDIAERLEASYVFPEVAELCNQHLRSEFAAGAFKDITRQETFAQALTTALQSISNDKHMRVTFEPERVRVQEADPLESQLEQYREQRDRNFGFEQVKILEDNVGYVEMRAFAPIEYGRETAAAAMGFLANTNAIIFDLRRNGGGSPEMVQFICSYFFHERTHLNSLYFRESDTTTEYWTIPDVPGRPLPDIPLYVLTSEYTFSAAEEFTYNLSTRGRATLVGETTGGGANPGGQVSVGEGFLMFIPTGRAINPITGTNWEGVGVPPDIESKASQALDLALSEARKAGREYREFQNSEQDYLWAEYHSSLQTAEAKFEDGQAEAAVKIVESALRTGRAGGIFDEATINFLGHSQLGGEKYDLAIAILNFNANAFPSSSNAWGSLGEAHMAKGETAQAIESYGKSLELDPHNANAIERLRRLKQG